MTRNRSFGKSLALFVLLFFATTATCLAQEPVHSGRPLWQSFDTRHTGGAPITHQARLDSNGILYAANDSGLLSFDGVQWRLFSLGAESRSIRTLHPLEGHSWLVGGPNTLGTVSPNDRGDLEWRDLISQLIDEDVEGFESVLDILSFNNRVLVATDRSILELADNTLSELVAVAPTGLSFTLNGSLFIEVENRIVQISEGGSSDIDLPPGWNDLEPLTVLSDQDTESLLVTRRAGLFRLTIEDAKVRLAPLWPELPVPLDMEAISAASRLSDGSFVMGSENGTFIHLGVNGTGSMILNSNSGYRAGKTRAITPLRDGSIMAFHDGGATWLNISDHLRVWDSENGLTAPVTGAALDRAITYIGTTEGLYQTLPDYRASYVSEAGPEPIVTLNTFARSTMRGHTSLLIGRPDGLYDFFDNRLEQITSTPPNAVHISPSQPTRVAIATDVGILLADFIEGTWVDAGLLSVSKISPALTLAETPDGRLLSVFADGSIRTFAADQWLSDSIDVDAEALRTQTLARQLTPVFHPFFSSEGDDVLLFMPGPPLRLDQRSETFVIDIELNRKLRLIPSRWISADQAENMLWLQTQTGLHGVNGLDEAQSLNIISPYTAGTPASGVVVVDESNDRVLVGSLNGLIEVPLRASVDKVKTNLKPPLLIRKVSVNGSHVYGGHGPLSSLSVGSSQDIIQLELSAMQWGLKCASMSVALSSNEKASAPSYWPLNEKCEAAVAHDWLSDPSKDYELRLMSDSSQLSESARLSVEVLNPWYRSAALPLFAALLIGLGALSGNVLQRRPWPEPIVRFLSLYAGLLLAWTASLASGLTQAGLSASLVATQLGGLAGVALVLPLVVQTLLKLRDINPATRS